MEMKRTARWVITATVLLTLAGISMLSVRAGSLASFDMQETKAVTTVLNASEPDDPVGVTPTPTVPASPEPKIDIRKQVEGADTRSVGIGSDVSFEIVVTNSGNVPLKDIQISDELAPGCAQAIGELAPGESRSLTCSVPSVTQSFTNTACVSGQYHWTTVQDCDPSSVNPVYQVFIPGSWRPYAYNLTVGYEDLELNHPGLDYDYNDFNTAIQTQFITDPEDQYIQRIVFTITPRARGGQYSHALHMLFPANVFPSDGTAIVTLKDQSGRPISSSQQPFIASQVNDYTVLTCSCDAFPGEKTIVNALEGTPYQNTQRLAEFSIAFNTPFPLNLDIVDENRIEIAHGAGLFFDPYLHVFNTNDDIHQGDPRIVSAPSDYWRWPEEGVRIDRAYPMVTGNPPDQTFPSEWWIDHNNCIYGDGVVCPE
jgi:uncharacterized repeat protein (TIGR01451 family)